MSTVEHRGDPRNISDTGWVLLSDAVTRVIPKHLHNALTLRIANLEQQQADRIKMVDTLEGASAIITRNIIEDYESLKMMRRALLSGGAQ